MTSKDEQERQEPVGAVSRRGWLKGAAALAASNSAAVFAQDTGSAPFRNGLFLYVGTYTGAIGNGGNGQGIYLFRMNPFTGALTQVNIAAQVPSPSWMALDPMGRYLYALNEVSNFNGTTNGSVMSFAINRATGALTPLNTVSSQGSGPAHLSVHPSGKYVLVANYGGGSIAVLPIQSNGFLGNATDVVADVGSVGPTMATSGPPGSFAISGHDAPHAHMFQSDPFGHYVYWSDLGQDRIYIAALNLMTGKLTPGTTPFVTVPPGDGPRHFAFHPNGRILYSIQEESSTIIVWQIDPGTGALKEQQQLSSLPPGFTGTDFTSEIRISSDGRFVYGANRLHDTIAVFAVDHSGGLTRTSEASTLGDYPRSFTIDPTGSYVYVCNQRSDSITSYRVNPGNGGLTFTGQYTPVGSPAVVVFLM